VNSLGISHKIKYVKLIILVVTFQHIMRYACSNEIFIVGDKFIKQNPPHYTRKYSSRGLVGYDVV